MSVYAVFCDPCGAVLPHTTDLDLPDLIACKVCGLVREADADLLAAVMAFAEQPPVQDMRFCPWCRSTLPADHDCPAGAVGCTTRQPDETPCGACPACIAVMTADLRRAEYEHGSPSDIETPWSST